MDDRRPASPSWKLIQRNGILRRVIALLPALAVMGGALWLDSRSPNSSARKEDYVSSRLASAGFADPIIMLSQAPTFLSICDVGQYRKRGTAIHWRTEKAVGIYCRREDGRSDEIVLLEGQRPSPHQGAVKIVQASASHQRLARTVLLPE